MKMIHKLAVALAFSASSAHAILTFDVGLNPQTNVNQLANYAAFMAQLTQLENQIAQGVQMYKAVTGARGMSDLLNNPAVYSNLPADYANAVSAIKNGISYANERAALPTSKNPKINAVYDSIAIHKAALTDAYSQANARIGQVKQLQASIDSASDPASKQDLHNRMASEIQSIQAQSQFIQMLNLKQERDIEEASQAAHRSFLCAEFVSSASSSTACPATASSTPTGSGSTSP